MTDDHWHTKYILNPDHSITSCDLMTWAVWFEDYPEARSVALTITEQFEISTVFSGIDYNWSGVGPPSLFETMVFTKDREDGIDHDIDRYATWDEAVAGHAAMVTKAIAYFNQMGVTTMGLLSNLLGSKAKDAVNQFSGNKDFLEGLCAACAMTAAAEGGIDDEEFDKALEVMMSNSAIAASFSGSEVEQVLGKMTKKTGTRMGKAELMEEIRQVVERDKSGKMGQAIVLVALDVADTGGISDAETAVMRKIADVCGVNYDKIAG